MLTFLQAGICFVAVCLLCIFLVRQLNMPSGLAPLVVLSSSMIYFTLVGSLNILSVGVWAYFALAIGCGVLAFVLKNKHNNKILTPSFLLFIFCSVGLLCLLAIRQPMLNEWDDFSLWGTAAKMSVETNTLYPAVESGFPWAVTQKPGFIVMAYFFNFFGEFAPWRMFFAYDIIMLAAFTAVCACVPFKKWQVAVPVYFVCALVPFINVYTRMIYFTTPYLTGYADIPMGILMGGAFAFYYAASQCENKKIMLWVCTIIGGVTLSKDTGMPLALLCAAVISVDVFVTHKTNDFTLGKYIKGVWAKILVCVCMVGTVGACYIGCSKYLGSLGLASNALGGESNMTPVQLVVNGLLMLFGFAPLASGVPFVEKFALVFNNMTKAFFESDITILGSGLSSLGFVISILLIAFGISADKIHRKRITLFGTIGLLSFIPYYAFIGFTYAFIFKGNQGVGLIDYNRYVGCYYAALILGALALLCISAIKEQRLVTIKTGIIMLAGGLALPVIEMVMSTIALGRRAPTFNDFKLPLALFCLLLFVALFGHFKKAASFTCLLLGIEAFMLFSYIMPRQLCIIDYPDVLYEEINMLQNNADSMNKAIGKPAKIFYISIKDFTGSEWFKYHYALYPSILDYSYGGGSIGDVQALNTNDEITLDVSLAQLATYLYESDNEYLYINSYNDIFVSSYQGLFADKITRGLYKINKKAGANVYDEIPTGTQQSRYPNSIAYSDTVRVMDNPTEYLSLTLVQEEELVL